MVSSQDPQHGRGLGQRAGAASHAIDDAALLGAEIVDVMEPPFPAVAAEDGVREAVELLADKREALLVNDGRARRGHPHARGSARIPGTVTGEDRSGEGQPAPSRKARFATRAVHAGLDPDPAYGSIIPPIHQTSTYVQPAPGEYVEDYDYARSANPTRAALERALGELEGGLASCFASGMAATHALLTAHCGGGDHVSSRATSTAAPTGCSTRCWLASASSTTWSTRPTSEPWSVPCAPRPS